MTCLFDSEVDIRWDFDYMKLYERAADAALAASVFHFGQISIPELKEYLRKEGIIVRI